MTAHRSRSTIFKVAEDAGVSITTVSHVFSGKRRVNAITRARIVESAARLDYHPNRNAQALAAGRTKTLALQMPALGENLALSAFFTQMLPTLSLAALGLGYSSVYVSPGLDGAAFVEPLISQRRIDGALLIDPVADDPFVQSLMVSGLPYVSIGRVLGSDGDNWVDNDHGKIAEEVVAHLLSRGYRRPALLTVDTRSVSFVADYHDAFQRPPAGSIVFASELSEQAARTAVHAALKARRPPDAFFCIHDRLAMGTCVALTEAGRRWPDDIGVVVIGDGVVATKTRPRLTSVRVFPEQTARAAMGLLEDYLQGRSVTAPVVVPAKLVARLSTQLPMPSM